MKNNCLYHGKAGYPRLDRLRRSGFLFGCLCLLSHWLTAQQPLPSVDTLHLLYTHATAPEQRLEDQDTLLDLQFRMYDPVRKATIDFGSLGNLGTAARPLLFRPQTRRGFDLGIHAYDLYQSKPENLRFYTNKRSFSEVFFTQGRTQFDGMVQAKYCRTFSKNTVFSLDYRSINNLGQYKFQRSRHNTLSLGVWAPIGKKYQFFVIFTKNTIHQRENGGIAPGTVFGNGQFDGPIAAPIQLPNQTANTRMSQTMLYTAQYYNFLGGAAGKRALRAAHIVEYSRFTDKFSDSPLNQDSFFYKDFLVDRRGIRQYVAYNKVENQFSLSTFKPRENGIESDLFSAGLAHSFYKVHQEPIDTVISNLFLTGKLGIRPSARFSLSATGAIGLFGNLGEYQVQGDLHLALGPWAYLEAGLGSQLHPPSLLEHRLFVSKRLIWENNFKKPLENTLWGRLGLPALGFEVTGYSYLVNNYIYFNSKGFAAQTTAPLQVFQLVLQENMHWRGFHFDNSLAWQQSNRNDVFRLPGWFSKNSLYFTGNILKNRLNLSLGADFRVNQAFKPEGYQPISAQFYIQDSLSQAIYPWLDVFAAFKVQNFRFFVRMENMSNLWNKGVVFFQTANYPQPFRAIRFGINWRFMDQNIKDSSTNSGKNGPSGRNSSGPPGRGF